MAPRNESAYQEMCEAYGEVEKLIAEYGDLELPEVAVKYPDAAKKYEAAKKKYHDAENDYLGIEPSKPDVSEDEFFSDIEAALWGEREESIIADAKRIGSETAKESAENAYDDMCAAYADVERLFNTYGNLEDPEIAAKYPEAAKEYQEAMDKYHEAEDAQTRKERKNVENEAMEVAQQQARERYDALQKEHCVRGAMMKCKCGSHCRRLNLPLTHGSMVDGRPKVNINDSVVGDENNIPFFGICESNSNPSKEKIILKKDYPRDAFGKKLSDEVDENIRGKKCYPSIMGGWKNTKELTKVDGAQILTGSAFLVCKYGGIIEIMDSGQNDPETLVGIGEKD